MEDINDKYHLYLNNEGPDSQELFKDDQEMKDFLDRTTDLKIADFSRSKSDLWDSIEENINQERINNKTILLQWKNVSYIAAVIVVLLICGLTAYNSFNKSTLVNHIAKLTENKVIDLPDGSRVYLNAESELSYTEEWDRIIDLKGEAFFDVTKGEKFTVNTLLGEVNVLGTSFNVSVRNNIFVVSCKTGKVKVSFVNLDGQDVLLTRGESVIFEKNTVNKSTIDILTIADWKEGTFHYSNRPVSEAFDEIKRQYNVDIKIIDKTISQRPFKGYFFTGDLQTSLSLVCEPMGLQYRIDGTTVVIESVKK